MTTLAIEWQTLVAMPEWSAQMAAADRLFHCRAEVIDADGTVLTDVPLDGGTVRMDGSATAIWSGELNLSTLYPNDETDLLHPLAGNRVRVWWREWIPALDGWGEVPLMTGWPEDPQADKSPGMSWTLQLFDSIAEAKRSGYGGRNLNVSSFTIDAALDALFGLVAPRLPRNIPDSAVTLPATYSLGSGNVDEDWVKVAAVGGLVVHSDRMGSITAGPAPTPSVPKADWQEGPNCRVVKLSRALKTSEIKNAVLAISTSSDVVPPITGTAQDDDPGSPTFVGSYGPYWTTVESDAIATQAAADNLAATTLATSVKPVDSTKVTITARPDLDAGDLINLGSPDIGVAGGYRVSSWSISLPGAGQAPSLMDVSMADR